MPLKPTDTDKQTAEADFRLFHELFAARLIIHIISRYRKPTATSPLKVYFADPAYTLEDISEMKRLLSEFSPPEFSIEVTNEHSWLQAVSEFRRDPHPPLNALVVSFNPTGPIRRLLSDIERGIAGDTTEPYAKPGIMSIICPKLSQYDPVGIQTGNFLADFREDEIISPSTIKDDTPFRELKWYLRKDKEFHKEPDVQGLVKG
jgi:hypothetical protein